MTTEQLNDLPETYKEPWVVQAMQQLVTFFDRNQSTIGEWVSQGMPRYRIPGKKQTYLYNLRLILEWRKERDPSWETKDRHGESNDGQSKGELEKEKLRVDIAKKKMEFAREAGDLLQRDVVLSSVQQVFTAVRTRLEAIPSEVASYVPPSVRSDVISQVQHKIGQILTEVSKWRLEKPKKKTAGRQAKEI